MAIEATRARSRAQPRIRHPTGPGYRPRVTDDTRPLADQGAPQVIAGRYRLTGVIGLGGMATIHRATDLRGGRDVAVKLLRPEISVDREFAERFRREALAATVLRHPNIVACLDTGTDPAGPFMVMELIEGEDLAARIRRDGALAPADVARIGLDIARGLHAAHTRGIVHRDVKPGNIMLARDGRSMITDFGIARLAADAEAVLPGTTLGSVQYFSPEQAQGRPTSAATDIYGLGLVLFEALTARRPWTGATTAELAADRVGAPAPSPRDLRPNTPISLDAVIVRALAPEPADRFENGGAMAAALEPIVGRIDRTGTTRTGNPGSPDAAPPVGRSRGFGLRRRRPVAVGPGGPGPVKRPYRSDGGLRRSFLVFAIIGVAIVGTVIALSGSASGSIVQATDEPTEGPTSAPPTDGPTATPQSTADATVTPAPTPTEPPTELCRPFLDLACATGPGRFMPTGFGLPMAFALGDGWSVARHDDSIVTLTRAEGSVTFAIDVGLADPSQGGLGNGGPRALLRAVAATVGLTGTGPATVRIDGRRGASTDLTPDPDARPEILVAGDVAIHAEPDRTTRIVALDVDGTILVIVIEPAADTTLRDLLDTADDVAASLRFG